MHRGIGASKSHINLALRLLKKAAHKFNRKIKQFAFITEKKQNFYPILTCLEFYIQVWVSFYADSLYLIFCKY